MKNQCENNSAPPKSEGWQVLALGAAFVAAVGAANIAFLGAIDKAQDADPVFVMPVAQQSIEDLGYRNVRFQTFNKAAGKPARITFTAERDFATYDGVAECTARSCPSVRVHIGFANRPAS